MRQGLRKHDWDIASHVIASILNSQMGRKVAVKPNELNPTYVAPDPAITLDDVLGLDP